MLLYTEVKNFIQQKVFVKGDYLATNLVGGRVGPGRRRWGEGRNRRMKGRIFAGALRVRR